MTGWEFNLNKENRHKEKTSLPDPPCYTKNVQDVGETEAKKDDKKKILEKKVKALATSGSSQIMVAFLMLYMTGSGLNLFTIIFTFQFIMQPAKQLLNVNSTFKQFEGQDIPLNQYKLTYVAIYGFILSIGLYKLYTVGLMPLSAADWIELIPLHSQPEVLYPLNN